MVLSKTLAEKEKPKQNPGPRGLAALLGLGRPLVMGILNVTPDSFSDGGQFLAQDLALGHVRAMAEQGADILDIGAESTRPYGGAQPVTAAEEKARLTAVLDNLGKGASGAAVQNLNLMLGVAAAESLAA